MLGGVVSSWEEGDLPRGWVVEESCRLGVFLMRVPGVIPFRLIPFCLIPFRLTKSACPISSKFLFLFFGGENTESEWLMYNLTKMTPNY